MTMNSDHKAIIKKIQKLLRLAARAGTEAEAQNAMSRVREMLDRHNVSMSDVNSFTDEDCQQGECELKSQSLASHAKILVQAMSLLFQCRGAVMSDAVFKQKKVVFVGVGSDGLVAAQTFLFLCAFANRRARERKIPRSEKRGYLYGFAHSILKRAIEINEARKKSAPQESGLVLSREGAINEYIKRRFKEGRELGKPKQPRANQSLMNGILDGNSASLDRPIEKARLRELAEGKGM